MKVNMYSGLLIHIYCVIDIQASSPILRPGVIVTLLGLRKSVTQRLVYGTQRSRVSGDDILQMIHPNGNLSFTIMDNYYSPFFTFTCIRVLRMETEATEKDWAFRTSRPRNWAIYLPGQVLCGNFAWNCGLFNRRIALWQVCYLFVCRNVMDHYCAKYRFFYACKFLTRP